MVGNVVLQTLGLLAICALWAVIGAALAWHRLVYCPAARRRKLDRIARQVQRELDHQDAPWWEKYLQEESPRRRVVSVSVITRRG